MKRFSIVENGYDVDEVNRFIDIVIGRLEKLNAENAAYVAKIDKLNLTEYIEVDATHLDDTNDKINVLNNGFVIENTIIFELC